MAASDRTSSRVQALLCAVAFVLAAALCHPVAEMGIYDDWSYVRSAELLAKTGHIHYNGWATAMLGWQLYPAAVCLRLFGFSFTVVRMTTIAVAAITAHICHRCYTRLGCRPFLASLATVTLVLSPLFLPLATTFMSDVYGLLAIVACLYCCVRALAAEAPRSALWLVAATAVNVVGGTARQIAWLGVLVMVPSTTWLLRRDRGVVLAGALSWVTGAILIVACMRWFAHQPYAVPEVFPHMRWSGFVLAGGCLNLLRLLLELGLLILPVLAAFLPALIGSRRSLTASALLGCVFALGALVAHHYVHHMGQFLVPTLLDGGNYVGPEGALTAWPEHGTRPILLPDTARLCLTLAVLLACFAVVMAAVRSRREPIPVGAQTEVSWRTLTVLTVPFLLAYLLLLMPRAAFSQPYDRYSLPLIAVGLVPLVRLYQQVFGARRPGVAVVLVVIFAAYSMATTHDAFAMYNGTHQAMQQMLRQGVPAHAIDAGWETDGWTQIVEGGYVHDLRLNLKEDQGLRPDVGSRPCPFEVHYLFPVVRPTYALAFQPNVCGGQAPFPVVSFRTWLPWATRRIYVVHDAPQ